MGYNTASCDKCKEDIPPAEVYTSTYDDSIRCYPCHIEDEIDKKSRAIKDKEDWLKETHLKSIERWRAEIKELKIKLSDHKRGT